MLSTVMLISCLLNYCPFIKSLWLIEAWLFMVFPTALSCALFGISLTLEYTSLPSLQKHFLVDVACHALTLFCALVYTSANSGSVVLWCRLCRKLSMGRTLIFNSGCGSWGPLSQCLMIRSSITIDTFHNYCNILQYFNKAML